MASAPSKAGRASPHRRCRPRHARDRPRRGGLVPRSVLFVERLGI